MVLLALALTSGTFAYTYNNSTTAIQASMSDTPWATYQSSAIQPDWDSIVPDETYGTETIVPIGPGDYANIPVQYPATGQHWDKVDDQPADDSATYISTSGTGVWNGDLYEMGNFIGAGGTETIDNVTFYIRIAAGGNYYAYAMAEFKTHGQLFSGPTEQYYGPTWVTLSWQQPVNPVTGEAWTWEEINDLQAGLALKGSQSSKPALCTQVYVVVDYRSARSQGEVPQGNLFDINPDSQYPGDLTVKIYIVNISQLIKAYKYLNMTVYTTHSLEAGQTPAYKVLSLENGMVEFSLIGGSASEYTVSITGGSYGLIYDNPD
jgi:hypothetical protein